MITIEYVSLRPASTMSGVTRFGRISLRHDPRRRDAFELDGLDEISFGDVEGGGAQHAARPRRMADSDGDDDDPDLRPDDRHEQQGEDELWEGEYDVDGPHDDPVAAAPKVRRRDAGDRARDDAEVGRGQRHDRSSHPPSSTRLSTSRPRVSPPRRLAFDGWAKGRVTKFVGRVRSDEGSDHRDQYDEGHDDEAEGHLSASGRAAQVVEPLMPPRRVLSDAGESCDLTLFADRELFVQVPIFVVSPRHQACRYLGSRRRGDAEQTR